LLRPISLPPCSVSASRSRLLFGVVLCISAHHFLLGFVCFRYGLSLPRGPPRQPRAATFRALACVCAPHHSFSHVSCTRLMVLSRVSYSRPCLRALLAMLFSLDSGCLSERGFRMFRNTYLSEEQMSVNPQAGWRVSTTAVHGIQLTHHFFFLLYSVCLCFGCCLCFICFIVDSCCFPFPSRRCRLLPRCARRSCCRRSSGVPLSGRLYAYISLCDTNVSCLKLFVVIWLVLGFVPATYFPSV
jgi:hypothetical protein